MGFGTLVKYSTGEALGAATLEDWLDSALAGLIDRRGIFLREDGYAVRVSGGPDTCVRSSDIAILRNKAVKGGPSDQVLLCRRALDGDEEAFRACAKIILTLRAEFHDC